MDVMVIMTKIAFSNFRDSIIHEISKIVIKLIIAQLRAMKAIVAPNLLNNHPLDTYLKNKETMKSPAKPTVFINMGPVAIAHKQIMALFPVFGNPECIESKLFTNMKTIMQRDVDTNDSRISGTNVKKVKCGCESSADFFEGFPSLYLVIIVVEI